VEAAPLEDILVTARKREENLQDVPIAITAVSGEQMRQNNIGTLETLAPTIPNLSFSQSVSGSDQFTIRGLGSGINGGFEQAVGLVVDGVYYGRTRFGRASFLDLERVEVLRGPQGALIGKNTTAGAINITTAKPTEEFEAYIKPLYEFEGSEGFNVEGAISGPIVQGLSARVALRYDDRDGYVDNVQTGKDDQEREDITVRGTLLWEPSDVFDAKLSYQYGNNEREGRTRQLSLCGDAFRNFDPDGPGPAPPGALFQQTIAQGEDCNANRSRSTINLQNGSPVDEEFNIDFDVWNLNANWDVGWATLTSVSGYSKYDAEDLFDLDSIPAELGSAKWEEDFEQFYQEVRATSTGDRFDWVAGILYVDVDQDIDFLRNFAALPPPLTPSSNLISTDQNTETWAVFGEFVWHINDQWDLTLGGRYTDEEKDADQSQTPTLLYSNTPTALPPGGPAFRAHTISDSRSEDDFSPQVTIQWRPVDDTMAYASFRQGFKGGGFDAQLDATNLDASARFEFDDETVDAYEIGLKTALLDKTLLLNLAVFYSEFDDLQVSTIDSASATFNVGNAAEAISQGVEAEATWAPTDQLTINAALAYLDAEYDDFPGAPCDATQTIAGTCPNDPQPGEQNLKNKDLPFSPDWSGTLSAEYVFPITSGLEMSLYGLLTYSDDFATVTDLDPNTFQDDYVKVDMRIGLGNQEGSWDVALIGRNIFDEETTNFCNDAQGGPFFLGSYFCFVDPPDSWSLQATLRF
jgi:outer membrane receptor protein involved in Fe transport